MTKIPDSGIYGALILAPQGRDAEVAAGLLESAGMVSTICADPGAFHRALGDRAAFAVVTEEALRAADLREVSDFLKRQPAWSDLPFIVLTKRGWGPEHNPEAALLTETLGNATLLERPFHPATFISMARSALRIRQRQFEARERIEALNEGEERLRTALLAGRLGTWELDLASWTLSASPTCKALFGRREEEDFTYADLIAAIHPEDRGRMQDAVRDSIGTGADYGIEYRCVRPDGSPRWAEIRARLAQDRAGRRRLVGVSSDITERKTAEQRQRSLNETLEERVAERTAALEAAHRSMLSEIAQRESAEAQLRQAQKVEMIGQLTGGVAHDFNNLLMAVLGNLGLLSKHIEDPKLRRLVDGAEQGARRGAALTQRMLAFARRQDLVLRPRDLVELTRGMSDLLERSAGPGIQLEIALPDSLPRAAVDGNQIELALLNLVVNARDAMPDGGVVRIEADVAEALAGDSLAPGLYARLSVSDTGVGMDAETLRKAIEPFFSTKELGKGTGLGLSMVAGLAQQLNGELRLRSTPGLGTVAELWLPVTGEPVEEPASEEEPAPAPDGEGPARIRILVVDDDALIAMSTVDMLEDLGHEVIEANSGAEALEILRAGREIDLLITDYSMPKMTGGQLAKAAREILPNLPILLATGYAELPPGSDLDLPRLGKPYQQRQLTAEIAKLLRAGAG